MNRFISLLQKRKVQNKKGFTLIELVVVLVIIAILAAITVPVVMGYIEDAREAEDYAKIGILNRSSSSYRVYVYKENPTQVDVFAGITDNKARQEKLMEYNLLDEVLVSRKGNYFYWNVANQVWELTDSSSSGGDAEKEFDGTIMDQGKYDDAKEWDSSKSYNEGEYVVFNGVRYKATGQVYAGNSNQPGKSGPPWKEIKLEYDRYNLYEKGDIILDPKTNTYYRGIADNPYSYQLNDPQYYYSNPLDAKFGLWESVKYNESTKTWEKIN